MSRTVLVLVRRKVVLEDAAVLVRALLEDGRYVPRIVCAQPEIAAALQEAVETRLEFVDFAGRAVDSRAVSLPPGEPPARSVRSGLRRSLVLRSLVMFARLVRGDWRMAALFRDPLPAAVLVFEDRAAYPEMVFLAHARHHGVRSLLVSFAASSVESDATARRDRPDHLIDVPPWRALKRWLANRYPNQARDTPWGRMLFFSAPESLALAATNLLDGRNWHYGGGAVDACTKLSKEDLENARAEGAPIEKFIVAGQPMMDAMYQSRARAAEIRAALAAKYLLRLDGPFLVCAVPQAGEHALVDWERHMELTATLFRALGASGGNVLLSLHPRSRPETYAALARESGCCLLEERLSGVLAVADIFVASYSSTVRWALLMGIPTIMIDLLGFGYEQFAGLPGSVVTRDATELRRVLQKLIADTGERDRMGREAAAQAAGREIFDGRVCARIIEALNKDRRAT